MFKQIIVWLRPNSSARKSLHPILLLLLSIWLLCVYRSGAQAAGYPESSTQTQERRNAAGTNVPENAITPLTLNVPVERNISGLETHSYQITAAAGQFIGVNVKQHGVDVFERLYGPDGKFITEYNFETRLDGEEKANFVAETAGVYRVDIKCRYKGSAGNYEVLVSEIRPATEHDRLLPEACRLINQALDLRDLNKYDEAMTLATRALELTEKDLGPNDPYVAYVLAVLGSLYFDKGDFPQAEQVGLRGLEIDKKALGLGHPQTAESMGLLGVLYETTGQFAKAEDLFQQSSDITEKVFGPDHPRMVGALVHSALVHTNIGDRARAERELLRAIEIADKTLEPDDLVLRDALNNLGLTYVYDKEYDRGEPYLERALAIGEKKFGPDSSELSMALQNLGLIAQQQKKDYPRALDLYWRAEKNLEKSIGPDHPRVTAILNNIANIYKSQGNYAKAIELHQRIEALSEKTLGPYHARTIISLGNIARTYAAMGDISNAIKYEKLTDEALEKHIELNVVIGSERQKLAFFDVWSNRTDRTISLHVNSAPNDATARDLALTDILQRKGRVLDAMADSLGTLRQRLSTDDRTLLDQLNATTAQLAKLALNGPGKVSPEEYQRQLTSLTDQKEKLEADISRRSSEFRAQSQPVTLDTVRAAIPGNAALVEFAVYSPFNPKIDPTSDAFGEPHYIVYILRPQGEVQWRELGPAKDIDDRIDAFRQALSDPLRGDVQQLARKVDEKVFRPVRDILGNTPQLLISPDGELNLVPFAALVDERGHYQVERYSFAYLTSGRDLLRLQVQRESKSSPVVVADPTFGAPALTGSSGSAQVDYSQVFFGPLPGVTEEVRELKGLLPEATFLTKEQATKAALKKLNGPKVLHIATHGFFLQDKEQSQASNQTSTRAKEATRLGKVIGYSDNPLMRSGLALAGANQSSKGNTDGIMTALEAAGLDLWGTKLVVLSACDTGVGEIKNGDGVYGLRRAFVLAGAESQVMSLWAVSDRSTRDLIVGYYQGLLQGAGRGEALRQVQLRMLKDKSRSHPYYWASFIQTGEWANLEGKR
ncbi:MAG TPA: CHAT domain-containing tetratricopeptide repeat protein [Blastocatellia bacterium]|nr:CHAT domain-containing tetratricopeptide repeat protein [Blastocatellia bacterium]